MCLGILAQRPQSRPLLGGMEGPILGLDRSGGEGHHQDPLHFERRLVPRRHVWLNRGSDLPIDEAASPRHRS
jgi:hypothetical protein